MKFTFAILLAVILLILFLLRKPLGRLRYRLARFMRPNGSFALANELGLIASHGKETLQVGANLTVPVTTKYLVYCRDTTQYTGKLGTGGSAAADMPLGVSPDAPYALGDYFDLERFGATVGEQLGYSLGAIAIDHLVYGAAAGLIGDLQAATAGGGGGTTYWCIGRATKTVTAASQQITFIPCDPYLITTTNGVLSRPANPL